MTRWDIIHIDRSIGYVNRMLYDLYTEGNLKPDDYDKVSKAYQVINEIDDEIEELYKLVDELEKKEQA